MTTRESELAPPAPVVESQEGVTTIEMVDAAPPLELEHVSDTEPELEAAEQSFAPVETLEVPAESFELEQQGAGDVAALELGAFVQVESTDGTTTREAEETPAAAAEAAPAPEAPPASPVLESLRRVGLPARPRLRLSFGWTPDGKLECDGVLMDERRELVSRERLDPEADPVVAQAFSYFASLLVRKLRESGAIIVLNPSQSPPPASSPPPAPEPDEPRDTQPPTEGDDPEV